eukprot:758757-Hanusia_phi.AAC.1
MRNVSVTPTVIKTLHTPGFNLSPSTGAVFNGSRFTVGPRHRLPGRSEGPADFPLRPLSRSPTRPCDTEPLSSEGSVDYGPTVQLSRIASVCSVHRLSHTVNGPRSAGCSGVRSESLPYSAAVTCDKLPPAAQGLAGRSPQSCPVLGMSESMAASAILTASSMSPCDLRKVQLSPQLEARELAHPRRRRRAVEERITTPLASSCSCSR